MADQKYYTPDIEEFHVGFECELKEDGEFKKHTIHNEQHLTYAILINENGKARVRCLDREDIESLGWKPQDNGFYEKDDFQMLVTEEPYNIQIFYKIGYLGREKEERIFWGVLKNKSELKKLMKQLNIE